MPKTCGFCGSKLEDADAPTLLGLHACSHCRSGDSKRTLDYWQFEEAHRQWVEPKTKDNSENKNLAVEVKRPTSVDLHATLSPESTMDKVKSFFGKGDPRVGVKSFDDLVRINVDIDFEPLLLALLEREGARAAIEELLSMGCTVDIGNQTISANIRNWIYAELPDMKRVVFATVALAVHVETFATNR